MESARLPTVDGVPTSPSAKLEWGVEKEEPGEGPKTGVDEDDDLETIVACDRAVEDAEDRGAWVGCNTEALVMTGRCSRLKWVMNSSPSLIFAPQSYSCW